MPFVKFRSALIVIAAIAGGFGNVSAQPTQAMAVQPTPITDPTALPVSRAVVPAVVIPALEAPWSMAFLPGSDMLITELLGQLRYVRNGKLEPKPITGLPPVATGGQGGLMDVSLHPDFAKNKLIYLSYSHGDESASHTRIARAELRGRALRNFEIIFKVSQMKPRIQHNGSRFVGLLDGTLLFTIGDGGNPPTMLEGQLSREQAQNPDSHMGKVIRIHDDGSIPTDNPFLDRPDAKREIYTMGHRNSQGMVRDPASGRIYASEHGSQGGDELNLIEAGGNYGWPRVAHAVEYGKERTPISPHRTLPGMVDPIAVWDRGIAPSGLTLYRGSVYPGWDGDLFAGGLRIAGRPNPGGLFRIDLNDAGKVVSQERIALDTLGPVRVRDVRTGPDGKLYLLVTDTEDYRDKGQKNGRLVRLDPVKRSSQM